jgi:Fe-S cluster assembly protein SufD
MTALQMSTKQQLFLEQLSAFYEAADQDGLSPLREEAWQKFQSLGLPSKQQDAFQYVPLRSFYESDTLRSDLPRNMSDIYKSEMGASFVHGLEGATLVFVDGKLNRELSFLDNIPSQVVILTLEEALRSSYGTFLKQRMRSQLQQESDAFACLNAALCSEGVFIYVPPKLELEIPLQCVHIGSGSSPVMFPKVHIFLGARSRLEWISSLKFNKEHPLFYNGYMDVAIEDGAVFECFSHNSDSDLVWGFETLRCSLKKTSRFRSHLVTFGGKSVRHDYLARLVGEEAEVKLEGLVLLEESKQAHINVFVEHIAPYCQSHQFFKTVLSDQSRSSFSGKIYVRKEAQKTQAYQLNHNLLLSDKAIANSKPNLEIFADDVKASHGATVSQIDEEQILYLRTRGLSSESAKALLTLGFCKDLLDRIPYPAVQLKLLEKTQAYLNKHK